MPMLRDSRAFSRCALVASIGGWLVVAAGAAAQFEPPAGYYSTATGTGGVLKSQLRAIIGKDYWNAASTSHRVRSYDNARQALVLLAPDPNIPGNVILIYSGVSVSGAWDAGITWNREHTWPDSRGLAGSGPDYTDLHQLRPCDPGVNSSRGNNPFGIGGGYWDPQPSTNPSMVGRPYVAGTNDRGEMARAMFYMATRYDGTDASTTDLELVSGVPSGSQMGDLTRLLEWHYSDEINTVERQRNQLLFSNTANPLYYQGNRNPFVDRPEFVWAIFGTAPNDSTLFIGGAPAGDGSSAQSVSFRVIAGTAPAASVVSLSRSGIYPTTYDATITGPFSVTGPVGQGRGFPAGAAARAITISPTSVGTPGNYAGSIVIDNTDLTTAGAGRGSADGNDVVTINAAVLSASNPSFDAGTDINSGTITSTFDTDTGVQSVTVSLHNFGFVSTSSLMDIDAVTGGGPGFSGPAVPVVGIGGSPASLQFWLDTTSAVAGPYSATFTILTSDENIPGQTASQVSLTWDVTINAAPPMCQGDADQNGEVNFADITSVLANYGLTPGLGDADQNGEVNFADITTVLANFGVPCP
jgi:endonuclease I